VSTKGVEAEILKEMMRKGSGAKAIRNKMQAYVDALKTEFSSGLILPAKDGVATAPVKKTPAPAKPQTATKTTDQVKSTLNLIFNSHWFFEFMKLQAYIQHTGRI